MMGKQTDFVMSDALCLNANIVVLLNMPTASKWDIYIIHREMEKLESLQIAE